MEGQKSLETAGILLNEGAGESGSQGGWGRGRGSPWRTQKSCLPGLLGITMTSFLQEKVIPSVIIEPASNNEGEGEHEITIGAESKEATDAAAPPVSTSVTPELALEQEAGEDSQPAPAALSASEVSQEVPPGFLYKVFPLFLSFNLVAICPSFALRPFCLNLWFSKFYFCSLQSVFFLRTALAFIPTSHCHLAGFTGCWTNKNYGNVLPYCNNP